MKIDYYAKDYTLNKQKKENIEKRLMKFEKYFKLEPCVKVKISNSKINDVKNLTVSLVSGKKSYRVTASNENLLDAVDEATEKLKKQIRRHKDMYLSAKKRRPTIRTFETSDPEAA